MATSSGTAVVTLPTDTQILITREFDAPRELVYKAYTTPELLRRWWSAGRGEMTVADVDLRVLREVGAVEVRGDGRRRLYRLNGQALKPIHDWVGAYEQTWSERFDQLDVVLDELKTEEEEDGSDR